MESGFFDRWSYPTDAIDGELPLTAEQIASWRNAGFTLVNKLIPNELLLKAKSAVENSFPKPKTEDEYDLLAKSSDFGSGGQMDFPTISEAVNSVTLEPRLLKAIEQLLGTESANIRLTQSDVWPKYGTAKLYGQQNNRDQRMHIDFPNHNLVYPSGWYDPDVVSCIIYYSDVKHCRGETSFVPRMGDDDPAYSGLYMTNTPGFGVIPWINNRVDAEDYLEHHHKDVHDFRKQLYLREVKVSFEVGSVLLYRHDLWHRGNPVAPSTVRYAHNLVFRRADRDWINNWNAGWATKMYQTTMIVEKLIAQATVQQRNVLGFPSPSHSYWNVRTIKSVRARYEPLGMDITPYLPK
eukprot:TRINITY_DN11453_c0_g1_i1.p1 TRINITY_DN11453_c0_g1~~TRINITY_DN11453_c0_g1_i1.p1  ORF type:complete len:351 (+),score=67.33 TRINITY_DN11453_c0_g1_i1:43-1095(+)